MSHWRELPPQVPFFCCDKSMLATTKLLFVATKNVTTKLLSRQTYFCRDRHVSVATKMILMAAPANDRDQRDRDRSGLTLASVTGDQRDRDRSGLTLGKCHRRPTRQRQKWTDTGQVSQETNATETEVD